MLLVTQQTSVWPLQRIFLPTRSITDRKLPFILCFCLTLAIM